MVEKGNLEGKKIKKEFGKNWRGIRSRRLWTLSSRVPVAVCIYIVSWKHFSSWDTFTSSVCQLTFRTLHANCVCAASAELHRNWSHFRRLFAYRNPRVKTQTQVAPSKRNTDNCGRHKSTELRLESVKTVTLDWTGVRFTSFSPAAFPFPLELCKT